MVARRTRSIAEGLYRSGSSSAGTRGRVGWRIVDDRYPGRRLPEAIVRAWVRKKGAGQGDATRLCTVRGPTRVAEVVEKPTPVDQTTRGEDPAHDLGTIEHESKMSPPLGRSYSSW